MRPSTDDQIISLFIIAAVVAIIFFRHRRWRGSGTAFGTSAFMSDKALRAAGMLTGTGLVLGRTFKGELIRLRDYFAVLLCGTPGSGKGIGIIIPNLLAYRRGSIMVFDTKGDLYETTAGPRAAWGECIRRLAPFNGGEDAFNPLDTIPSDSPTLVDSARALAEALVVRQGTEPDPYWNDKSVQVICAVLVLVLLRFTGEDRNLSTVQEIVSDPDLLKAASSMLQDIGGIPGRLGAQLKTHFDKATSALTKEGTSVLGCVTRHLSFLDSELVAKAIASSTFDPAELRKPGITLFLQIPPDQLEAQKGLLRCWVTALVRVIGAVGDERDGETLFLLDEASALGSLPAIEEAMVRGRSAGIRLLMAYQSDSQITTAFKGKPSLLYDNCSAQIYLGAPSSYETAERLSKSLGAWTQVIEQYSENESHSWQAGSMSSEGGQASRGSSLSYSETERSLKRPEELLQQSNDRVIVLQRGSLPILANRVKWYADPEFNPALPRQRKPWFRWNTVGWQWRLWAAGVLALILLGLINRSNH